MTPTMTWTYPIIRGGLVYVAESCWAGGRTKTALCCLDAEDGGLLRGGRTA